MKCTDICISLYVCYAPPPISGPYRLKRKCRWATHQKQRARGGCKEGPGPGKGRAAISKDRSVDLPMAIPKRAADRRRRHGRQRRPRQTASAGATGLAARYRHTRGLAASESATDALVHWQRDCSLTQSPQVRSEHSSDCKLRLLSISKNLIPPLHSLY